MIAFLQADMAARFAADAALKLAARSMYFGLDGTREKSPPFIDVTFTGGERMDTFANDIESHSVRVTLVSKQGHTQDDCAVMVENFLRVFDDYQYADAQIRLESWHRTGPPDGPRLVDGLYQAVMDYEVIAERVTNVPVLPNT